MQFNRYMATSTLFIDSFSHKGRFVSAAVICLSGIGCGIWLGLLIGRDVEMVEGNRRGFGIACYGVWRMRCDHMHREGKRKLDVANRAASGISYGRIHDFSVCPLTLWDDTVLGGSFADFVQKRTAPVMS